jgi:hypothetical protein
MRAFQMCPELLHNTMDLRGVASVNIEMYPYSVFVSCHLMSRALLENPLNMYHGSIVLR